MKYTDFKQQYMRKTAGSPIGKLQEEAAKLVQYGMELKKHQPFGVPGPGELNIRLGLDALADIANNHKYINAHSWFPRGSDFNTYIARISSSILPAELRRPTIASNILGNAGNFGKAGKNSAKLRELVGKLSQKYNIDAGSTSVNNADRTVARDGYKRLAALIGGKGMEALKKLKPFFNK